MKAINSKSVTKSYLLFSFCMAGSVFIFILMWWSMIFTAKYESSKIEAQTEVLDRAFTMQTETVDRVDSLYNYMVLINSDKRINDVVVQNVVSTKKMQLLRNLESMNERDILLYRNLTVSMNKFLLTKDSIRVLIQREDLVKNDLQRCITADKQALQKLSLEGMQTNIR